MRRCKFPSWSKYSRVLEGFKALSLSRSLLLIFARATSWICGHFANPQVLTRHARVSVLKAKTAALFGKHLKPTRAEWVNEHPNLWASHTRATIVLSRGELKSRNPWFLQLHPSFPTCFVLWLPSSCSRLHRSFPKDIVLCGATVALP